MKQIHKGKAPDIFNLSIEHFTYTSDNFTNFLFEVIKQILHNQKIPEILKQGVITPVYKRKGYSNEACNYRGITVLPVMCKLIEVILRKGLDPYVKQAQSPLQRGFTRNSSPMNCALIIDEYIRDAKDSKETIYVATLDAKSAFDVVSHPELMRKVYNIGVDNQLWTLINDLHVGAVSTVKWQGQISDPFDIKLGVRQGGILSADLYKVYINDGVEQARLSGHGAKIGNISVASPAVCDDLTFMSKYQEELQILLSIGDNYSDDHRYFYQAKKSAVLPIYHSSRVKPKSDFYPWTICSEELPVVEKVTHLGIIRAKSHEDSVKETVAENIKKSRRTLYSLMSSGVHGENGLDIETKIHILRTYVLPVLMYGLEVLQPAKNSLMQLEKFLKRTLKQIMSLAVNAPDPAVYALSGILPVEAQIHIKTLTMYNGICLQEDTAIEKQLAIRQLSVKDHTSFSWFINVNRILLKYELPSARALLVSPVEKLKWKRLVKETVHTYWKNQNLQQSSLYDQLHNLNLYSCKPGSVHPIVKTQSNNIREVRRISVKVKLVTGTYIVQSVRAKFSSHSVSSTCLLCKDEEEDLQHFLLECSILSTVRDLILQDIDDCLTEAGVKTLTDFTPEHRIAILLDATNLTQIVGDCDVAVMDSVELHARRLCFVLHTEKHKLLLNHSALKKRNGQRPRVH